MAQTFLSDFFRSKKQGPSLHPSKRRKLDPMAVESKIDVIYQHESKSANGDKETGGTQDRDEKQDTIVLDKLLDRPVKSSGKSVCKNSKASRTRKTRKDKRAAISSQTTIKHALSASTSLISNKGDSLSLQLSKFSQREEATSCWDEHDGPQTPRKNTHPLNSLDVHERTEARPHRRRLRSKKTLEDTTPEKEKTEASEHSRKEKRTHALAASRKYTELMEKASDQAAGSGTKNVLQNKSKSSGNKDEDEDPFLQTCFKDLVGVNTVPISPLPDTPELVRKMQSKNLRSVESLRLKAANEKCKLLSEVPETSPARKETIAPEVIRARLEKCGKLEALKSKLAEMNSTLKAVRKIEEEKNKLAVAADKLASTSVGEISTSDIQPVTEPKGIPAYERFEYLAREGPPTLVLPGKFQRLLSMFQSTDTVVSMLFNRQETITFTKLQTAVQSMTRKNFDEKTIGQIKSVYPSAYNYRQEKDVPCFGKKASGYQLTVEPNLKDCGDKGTVDEDGKPIFQASALLKRKRIFHSNLFDITVKHHNDFLSKMKPPVHVTAAELTRWHPHFPLDSVPDVAPALLPKPPVKSYQTAKQLLETATGNLPSRVKQAVENVAMSSVSNTNERSATGSEPPLSKKLAEDAVPSVYKGIPLALLERIRAKEVARIKAALTRDPAEDRKTEMMRRLPNMIRSLSSCFITEKKPSLSLPVVVEKLADSYTTCISQSDVEAHLQLLRELVPHWLQIIEISSGKYVKIDKNVDIMCLISKIENIVKSRK